MRRRLPWLLVLVLGAGYLVAFGPFTNTIYRSWFGVSNSVVQINAIVSPTALPTRIVTYQPQRYAWSLNLQGSGNYACCTYSNNSGGTASPMASPSASACGVGTYLAPGSQIYQENIAPALGFDCITVTGNVNFSGPDQR